MGTTVYDRSMSQAEARAECDSICTWDNEASRSKVLQSGITPGGYYAAVETHRDGKRTVWAAVFKITLCPFSYKDMSEDMGPYLHGAPRRVLEALEPLPAPPTVTDWSECKQCDGRGTMAPPNTSHDCWSCEGRGEVPTDPAQIDRHANARKWRAEAWSRHGGAPQGKQLELI